MAIVTFRDTGLFAMYWNEIKILKQGLIGNKFLLNSVLNSKHFRKNRDLTCKISSRRQRLQNIENHEKFHMSITGVKGRGMQIFGPFNSLIMIECL